MFYVRKLGLLAGIAAIVLSVVLPPTIAHAQATTTRPPLSLTTSPIPLSVITQPGKTVTADLRVKNNGTSPEVLKIELLKFGANGDSGNPQLHEREAKDTYFDWVSFSENTFTAEPNVWKTIHMTIKTPPSAAFGYYLAVLFSRATPDKPTGGASAVEGGVASLVLLDVEAPGAKREAKVSSLNATRKVYEFLPATLDIKLRNSGNVHVAPTGSVFIKRGGQQVAVLDFNTARGNILPNSSRAFQVVWNDGFPSYDVKTADNKTTSTLKWDFSKLQKFRFGHYTATLVAVYDDGQRDIPVEATVGFWVIPWRILGVALLIFLLVGAGVWMILRSMWKKVRRPGGKSGSDDSSTPAPAAPANAPTTEANKPDAEKTETAEPVDSEISKPEVTAPSSAAMPAEPSDVPPDVADNPVSTDTPTSKITPSSQDSDSKLDTPKTAPELKD
jgi:hypothetical protein